MVFIYGIGRAACCMYFDKMGVLLPFKELQDASKLASESQKVAGRWGAPPQARFAGGDFRPLDPLLWPP